MRKTLRLLSYILSVVLVIAIASCDKEGPAGPAGATGPAGPAGPAGSQGPAGAAGTANVIYSDWIDTVTYGILADPDTIAGAITVPLLTTDILNQGEIKVYANLNTPADPLVVALPWHGGFFLGEGGFVEPVFFTGEIDIVTNRNLDGVPLRYILIPGGTHARMAKIDWNDYNQVKAYLGLKD